MREHSPLWKIYHLFLNIEDVKRLAKMEYFSLPMYARGCKGLPGWFGTLFFHVCPFDREGGGDNLGNAHIEPTHFKKGLPLVAKRSVLFKIRKAEKGPSQVSVMQP